MSGGYTDLIKKATAAPDADLPAIETLMRDEVFHSTLDWQSASQFKRGAKKAYRILRMDREAPRLTRAQVNAHAAETRGAHRKFSQFGDESFACDACFDAVAK